MRLCLLYLLLPLAFAQLSLNITEIGKRISDAINWTKRLSEIASIGPKNEDPNAFFYLFNAFLIGLILLAIAASLIDYYVIYNGMIEELKGRPGWKMLFSFSIPRNTISIFSVGKESPDAILCLDAMRFLSFVVVANHHSLFYTIDGAERLQLLKRESEYILSDVLFSGAYNIIDTFFLISGILVALKFFKWIMYYVHRWLRLTPSYLLFIGLFVAWTPRLHDTIPAMRAKNQVRDCENNWWMNALYINNFGNFGKMCYPLSWFLAVDMQLYCVAPIFLLAIYYSWKAGLIAVIGGTALSLGITIFLTVHYDLLAVAYIAKPVVNLDYGTYIYSKPWTRCVPYLIGIMCGYFIVIVRLKIFELRKLKKWEMAVCWLLSTIFVVIVVFSAYDYIRGNSDWNVAARSLYNCLSHIGWTIAVAWVIIACSFGWAGPVKTIIEHPLWHPLGRLSYCAFLAHWFMLICLMNGRSFRFVSFGNTFLTVTIPLMFMSYVLAYAWSCLVELPFGNIEVIVVDLITSNGRGRKANNNTARATPPEIICKMTAQCTSIEVNYHK